VLAVAFGNEVVGSSPTIGIFPYVAQAVECVLAVAFGNELVDTKEDTITNPSGPF